MTERIIGHIAFVDGVTRPVHDDGARQYIMEDGERVYGLFMVPEEDRCDLPLIVPSPEGKL